MSRKVIDLTGSRFGRLIVVSRYAKNSKGNHPIWVCKCDCGSDHMVVGHHLRYGASQSCGCLRRETTADRMREAHRASGHHCRDHA